jgi:hypothetical protein
MKFTNIIFGVFLSFMYIFGENYLNDTEIKTTISNEYQRSNYTTDLPDCKITDTNTNCHLNFTGLDDFQAEILKYQIICNMGLTDFKDFFKEYFNNSREVVFTEFLLLKAVFLDTNSNYLVKGCYQYDKVIFIKNFTENMIKQEINNYYTLLQILAKIFLGIAVSSSLIYHVSMIIYSLLSSQILILLHRLITW